MAKYLSMEMTHKLRMEAVHKQTSDDTQISHISGPSSHEPIIQEQNEILL